MDPSLLLGRWYALYAMHAALVLELGIDAVAFDDSDHFFKPADRRLGSREDLHFPALQLGIAGVHPENFCRKQCGFISPGSSADFEDHVLLVVRILREQQKFEFF